MVEHIPLINLIFNACIICSSQFNHVPSLNDKTFFMRSVAPWHGNNHSKEPRLNLCTSPPLRWVHEANNELDGRVSLLEDDLDDLESESDEEEVPLPPPRPRNDAPDPTRPTPR